MMKCTTTSRDRILTYRKRSINSFFGFGREVGGYLTVLSEVVRLATRYQIVKAFFFFSLKGAKYASPGKGHDRYFLQEDPERSNQ